MFNVVVCYCIIICCNFMYLLFGLHCCTLSDRVLNCLFIIFVWPVRGFRWKVAFWLNPAYLHWDIALSPLNTCIQVPKYRCSSHPNCCLTLCISFCEIPWEPNRRFCCIFSFLCQHNLQMPLIKSNSNIRSTSLGSGLRLSYKNWIPKLCPPLNSLLP